jgi:GSH-dependent disulfide-bond oxidoreductase
MIDFYALTSPNVQKVFIVLEELELPHRIIPVDVWNEEQFKPEFAALNPNKKIPVIVDHEGPGRKPYTVFESGAILMYLADKTGRLLPADMAKRYDVIQWLMIQLTGVGPTFGQFVHFSRFAPAGNEYSLSRYRTEMRRLYDLLEQRLGVCPYLGGADYSIADIATFPWTRNHDGFGVKWAEHPNPRVPPSSARSPRSTPSCRAATTPPTRRRTASSAAAVTREGDFFRLSFRGAHRANRNPEHFAERMDSGFWPDGRPRNDGVRRTYFPSARTFSASVRTRT